MARPIPLNSRLRGASRPLRTPAARPQPQERPQPGIPLDPAVWFWWCFGFQMLYIFGGLLLRLLGLW